MRLSNHRAWDMHPDDRQAIPGMADALLARILKCFEFTIEQPGRPAESSHDSRAIERSE